MIELNGPVSLEHVSRADLIARAAMLGLDPVTILVDTPELRRRVARAENRDFAAAARPPVTPTEHVQAPAMLGEQYLLFVDFSGRTPATDSSDDEGSTAKDVGERIVPPGDYLSATCATSAVATDPGELCPDLRTKKHRVILDIDVPVHVVPSSTPGHGHLYIDHELSWDDYERLMLLMAEIGLLEHGYVAASIRRGFTSVRLPWVRKTGTTVAEA